MKLASPWPALTMCLLWLASNGAQALEVPELSGRVNDRANVLGEATERQLTERLKAYESATGHQYAVLTIPSLEGDPIEDFSIRVVEAWKLGRDEHDDGLLMLVVPEDRKMRIEVGYGLEGDIPDILAGRIIRNVMAPRFRQGDFEGGITQALELLMKLGQGEEVSPPPPPRRATRTPSGGFGGNLLYLGLLLLMGPGLMFLRLFGLGRRRRGMFWGGYYGGMVGGFGGMRGGGLGGMGGGGFGGGGGGFGGGGASGSW